MHQTQMPVQGLNGFFRLSLSNVAILASWISLRILTNKWNKRILSKHDKARDVLTRVEVWSNLFGHHLLAQLPVPLNHTPLLIYQRPNNKSAFCMIVPTVPKVISTIMSRRANTNDHTHTTLNIQGCQFRHPHVIFPLSIGLCNSKSFSDQHTWYSVVRGYSFLPGIPTSTWYQDQYTVPGLRGGSGCSDASSRFNNHYYII